MVKKDLEQIFEPYAIRITLRYRMIPEDVQWFLVLAWSMYELLRFCSGQRVCIGDEVVHTGSGRLGRVRGVFPLLGEVDVALEFDERLSFYWICTKCATQNWQGRFNCRQELCREGKETSFLRQPTTVCERRSLGAWRKRDAWRTIRLSALFALTAQCLWNSWALPLANCATMILEAQKA